MQRGKPVRWKQAQAGDVGHLHHGDAVAHGQGGVDRLTGGPVRADGDEGEPWPRLWWPRSRPPPSATGTWITWHVRGDGRDPGSDPGATSEVVSEPLNSSETMMTCIWRSSRSSGGARAE